MKSLTRRTMMKTVQMKMKTENLSPRQSGDCAIAAKLVEPDRRR